MTVGSLRIPMLMLVGVLNMAVWWNLNQAHVFVESPDALHCISWNPTHDSTFDPENFRPATQRELEADLHFLKGKTRCVRTYYAYGGLEEAGNLAGKFQMTVIAGAWITDDTEKNRLQLENLVRMTRENEEITHVIIGSETLQFRRAEREDLFALLDEARERIEVPVSTSESWFVWMLDNELVEHVDFIAFHALPYWHGIGVENAVDWVFEVNRRVQQKFPDKPIFLAETGWPASGPTNEAAAPGTVRQARFVRSFASRAYETGLPYNLLEAFDQPWKITSREGRVGSHWGLMSDVREEKFAFAGPVVPDPNWATWAAISTGLGFLLCLLYLLFWRRQRPTGYSLVFLVIYFTATTAVVLAVTATREYMLDESIVWLLIFPGALTLLLVLTTQGAEVGEVLGDAPTPLTDNALAPQPADAPTPLVSIHLPCRNEPPDMVIA